MIKLKRAYEKPSSSDGLRILVDRLWPRGVRKAALKLHAWEKDVAPTTELRKWFNHDPKRWSEFKKLYKAQLKGNEKLAELRKLSKKKTVTLIYGAKDPEHTHALVLQDVLK